MWTRLATRAAAADALRRPQCEDPGCQRAHIVALVDHGEARVIPMPPPEQPPLSIELEQLYGWT